MSTSLMAPPNHPLTHIEKSNLPSEKKTAIREYWDGLHSRIGAAAATGTTTGLVAATAKQGGMLIRAEATAAMTGISLALIEHTFGSLDLKAFGLSVPVDGVIAGGGALASLASPYLGISELAPEFRTVAAVSTGILMYRKGKEHFAKTGSGTVHGLLGGGKSLKEVAKDLGA